MSQNLFIEEPKLTDDPRSMDQPFRCPTQRHCRWAQQLMKGFTTEMWKVPWESTETIWGLWVCTGYPGSGSDRDQSCCPLRGVMCVGKSCVHPDVGTFQLQSKQCLLVLPSRLKRRCGGCVMGLECDSVWKTRRVLQGCCAGPCRGWEGKAAGHVFHVQEHSSLSLSVCGGFDF